MPKKEVEAKAGFVQRLRSQIESASVGGGFSSYLALAAASQRFRVPP